ncbi:hypothetical protein SLS56_003116 [Neofusicoccum ribis]|uniref:Fibroin-3 related protein n=1 Tax=Neofusicoccum ribis TaxID=45134 RepID=A0ABR3T0H5_9PEZI
MASPMALGRRDLSGTIDGVKSSFSSWDACMSKAYCNCLSCCNACCPNPRKGHRRVESPPPSAFPNNQQYQSQPPMYSGPGWNQSNVPQYATFDVSSGDKKFNEDALPAMPTWETAKSTKVEVNEVVKEQPDDIEMKGLDLKPSPTNSSAGPSPVNTRSPAPQSDYGFPLQPQPVHPPASFANSDFSTPNSYGTPHDYRNGPDNNSGYFNGQQPQQAYGIPRHASPSPSPYQDQNQPYHYASDPYGQQGYGHDHGAGGYGQQYDTASTVGGYAPSSAPTGYAPSGSTRYEPSMHNTYQDSYQHHPPMPPMPPIDRAGTASPYQQYDRTRPPFERAATSSPYQALGPRPPVERAATSSPYQTFNPGHSPSPMNGGSRWERMGANRAPGGYRDV